MIEQIVGTVPISIIALDLNGEVVFANASAERLLGLERGGGAAGSAETGRWRVADPRMQTLLDDLRDHVSRRKDPCSQPLHESFELSWDLSGENLRYLFVRIQGLCTGDRELTGWSCVLEDITAQKEAEAKLRESEAFYRTLFEHAGFGIALVDPDTGRRVAFNRTLHERLGYTREEYQDLTVGDIQYDDTRENALQRGRLALREGASTFEERHRKKDGKPCDVLVSLVPVSIGGKTLVHAISLDISEKKRLESDLRQAQKMEAIGRLAGGVAHDFNNMLNVMVGYSDLALLKLAPGSPLHDDIEEIRKAALRSAELTRQLLAFSRRQIIAPKAIQLNDIIADQIEMLRRLIGEEIRIDFRPHPQLWLIKIDPGQVHQILTNLTANARDAIDGVGTVRVETGNTSVKGADVHMDLPPGDYVLLSVTDTGSGMDSATLEHIFEPFFTTKADGKGTGLGLATVYGIVKQNDGGVHVYSEPGAGTTIKLYFPRLVGDARDGTVAGTGHEREGVDAGARTGEKTILIVEDEPALLQLTRAMLEGSGYKVIGAGKPSEAITLCRQHANEIDLLLSDVTMPEMNGLELQARIRAIRPTLRTLFMSGHSADIVSKRGVIEDGLRFISKPFTMKELIQKVRSALTR